jgi:hypothetical protein
LWLAAGPVVVLESTVVEVERVDIKHLLLPAQQKSHIQLRLVLVAHYQAGRIQAYLALD